MQRDSELETWRQQWHTQDGVMADLRHRVERELRKQRLGQVAAVAVTIAFGAGIPLWAIVSRRPDVVVLAAGVWLFIVITWAVSWRLDRGLNRPPTASTAAYLEFCITSCRRGRSAITAASVLYAALFTFNVAWVYQTRPRPAGMSGFLTSPAMLVAFGVTAVLGVIALRARRTLGRELENLLQLRRQL